MKILPNGLAIIERDTHFSRSVQERGALVDEGTRAFLAPLIKPGSTVIDVGANIGTYTGIFLEAVGPAGKVYAIEPNPEAFDCLLVNCPKALCFKVGCASEFGKYTVKDYGDNVGSCYLEKDPSGSVTCGALDDMMSLVNPDFIKIDVEGMECEVILGAVKMLERSRPTLYVEYNRGTLARYGKTVEQLRELLFRLGYEESNLSEDPGAPMLDAVLNPKRA